MVYIYKGQENVIVTDNVVSYIPDAFSVYLDNVFVGSFNNESTDVNYLAFTMSESQVAPFQNMEFKLKIEYLNETIKEELCIVKDLSLKEEIINKSKAKTIKYYE